MYNIILRSKVKRDITYTGHVLISVAVSQTGGNVLVITYTFSFIFDGAIDVLGASVLMVRVLIQKHLLTELIQA